MKQKTYFIESPNIEYIDMFRLWGWQLTSHALEADVVVFTGGSDVSPSLYNQARHPRTFSSPARDKDCKELFDKVVGKKPMVGICRGAQFLNVMSGGLLYQHVNNHAIGGLHEAIDSSSHDKIMVSSTHHQMMVPSPNAEILLYANLATQKELRETRMQDLHPSLDVESCFYEETHSLCFQPHPEFFGRGHECHEFFKDAVEQYLL